MEILESAPPTMLRIKLDFSKPMKAQNETVFTLQSTGEMTKVTWTMTGVETLPSRIFGLFVNLDKMIGKDFEAGLQNLKEIVEA